MARGIDAINANYLVNRNSSKVSFEPFLPHCYSAANSCLVFEWGLPPSQGSSGSEGRKMDHAAAFKKSGADQCEPDIYKFV